MHYRMVTAAAATRRWAAAGSRSRRRSPSLTHPDQLPPKGRQRRPGGGRKARTGDDPTLAAALL